MKKTILLALTALMMVGCGTEQRVKYKVSDDYIIVEIDSCEYVKYYATYGFQHKGNCRYCAERRKQELKEMIKELK